MKFEKNIEEHYVILTLLEEKLVSYSAPEVKEELVMLTTAGARNIILNLKNVKYIDSSGLSVLLLGNRICLEIEGCFVVCSPTQHVQKLIEISHLQKTLNIVATEEEAIEYVFMSDIEGELKEAEDAQSANN